MSPSLIGEDKEKSWAQVGFIGVSTWDDKTYINTNTITLTGDTAF